jgi:hypothetical protein
MTIGTRSVLYGAHCALIHPWIVALAWWRLYGFPWDPRLWIAFFVHDLGYLGKPNMDGPEGETHPLLGARVMAALFDRADTTGLIWLLHPRRGHHLPGDVVHLPGGIALTSWWDPFGTPLGRWGQFTLLHSRYFAKRIGLQPSRLCIADKLALALTPAWLYLPMTRATGEIREYMAHAKHRIAGNEAVNAAERTQLLSASEREWFDGVRDYVRRWAYEHRDGKLDTWTSATSQRAVLNEHGVWQ